jgi:hypothetical protein
MSARVNARLMSADLKSVKKMTGKVKTITLQLRESQQAVPAGRL